MSQTQKLGVIGALSVFVLIVVLGVAGFITFDPVAMARALPAF